MKCLQLTLLGFINLLPAPLGWSLSVVLPAILTLPTSPVAAIPVTTAIQCDSNSACHPDSSRRRRNPIDLMTQTSCDPRNPYGCPDSARGSMADPNLPYIISPSETALQTDRPFISWHAVPNATSYTVLLKEIADTGTSLSWQRSVNQPPKSTWNEIRIPYPTDAPALQPGKEYKLIVEVRVQPTEKRIEPGESQFRMLSEGELQKVRAEVQQAERFNLSPEDKTLLYLYAVYQKYNLIADARDLLEELVTKGSKNSQVFRLLGDLYYKQRLFYLAKIRYEMAIQLATRAGNREELKFAQEKLQEIHKELNQP